MKTGLEERISPENVKKIRASYPKDKSKNLPELLEVLSELVVDTLDVQRFEELLKKSAFFDYLEMSAVYSKQRFRQTIYKLGSLIVSHSDVTAILRTIEILMSKEYKQSLKTYFTAPIDYELYDMYETEVIGLAEQSFEAAKVFIRFSEALYLRDLKSFFLTDGKPSTFQRWLKEIPRFILRQPDYEELENYIRIILSGTMRRIADVFENEKEFNLEDFNVYYNLLTEALARLSSEGRIQYRALMEQLIRGAFSNIKNCGQRRVKLLQLTQLAITIFGNSENELLTFIAIYGFDKKSISEFLWEALFQAKRELLGKYLGLFISQGFIGFTQFYSYDTAVMKFMIQNLLFCLSRIELTDFPQSLLPLVMKLLMEQKIEILFLKKRQEFSEWVTQQSQSMILQAYLARILFYEYIFIHREEFEKEDHLKLLKFCDEYHCEFCRVLDETITAYMKKEDREKNYQYLFAGARRQIWNPAFSKYTEHSVQVSELFSIVNAFGADDLFLSELDFIPEEHFSRYYAGIKKNLKEMTENPTDEILQCFLHDYWLRLYLERAMLMISKELFPLIGFVTVHDNEKNMAYTDGKTIFLPEYIAYFSDDLDELEANRNMTCYLALAFHEAGHIVGGSFVFDLQAFFNKSKYPKLFHFINNVFEDYRIETYLKTVYQHPQIAEILDLLNLYFSTKKVSRDIVFDFLSYISDAAWGYTPEIEKYVPDYRERIDRMLATPLNCGRFGGLKNFAEYGIDRLKFIDVRNPFAAYQLAAEFYEIMKTWPEIYLQEFENNEAFEQRVRQDGMGSQGEANRIMTEEELKRLYSEYNANPKKFYEDNGIKIFPGTFGDPKRGESTSSGDSILLGEIQRDYEAEGTFDTAHHTAVDEEGASRQKELAKKPEKKNWMDRLKEMMNPPKKKKPKVASGPKKKRVISLDPMTDTRSLISMCYETEINVIDRTFLELNRQYDPIIISIYHKLKDVIEDRAQEIVEPSSIEGEIDIERLIELLVDKSNRSDSDFLENVIESKKELKVVIGLDISGSTDLLIHDPINPKGHTEMINGTLMYVLDSFEGDPTTILIVEKHFALIFSKALRVITENVDVYAFNSVSATNIYHAVPVEALSSFKSDNANRDGDFIRYITSMMLETDEDLKYFFFISDGAPSSINYEGRNALDDTLLAMQECRKAGIRLFYFNIDRVYRDYFTLFKEQATFAEYFSNPEELIDIIPELMESIAEEIV